MDTGTSEHEVHGHRVHVRPLDGFPLKDQLRTPISCESGTASESLAFCCVVDMFISQQNAPEPPPPGERNWLWLWKVLKSLKGESEIRGWRKKTFRMRERLGITRIQSYWMTRGRESHQTEGRGE